MAQQPYDSQDDHYASGPTLSNLGASYPPLKSSILGFHPPSQPHPTNDTRDGRTAPIPSYQDPLLRHERSPSPTPSEIEAMKRPFIDWKVVFKWRTYAKVKYIPYYIALIVITVLVILMSVFHAEIVKWLKPAADWMHSVPFGWVIPIVILVVLSFPPLFGHEIVGVLCGLVWGLWIGFLIMCAGTLLGEICTYYVFKYFCRSRGEKVEKTKASYACLARVVREGGFKVCLVARLSALPGHFTTAIFSTCGIGIFAFTLAAILSLPKQFITVYVGVVLQHSGDSEEEKQKAKTSRLISNIVLGITLLITIVAMWWIWRLMLKVRPAVLRERRIAKKRAMPPAAAAEAPLVDEANPELNSILGHAPVKENEGSWGHGGGHGYPGISQNPPGAPYNGRSGELNNPHFATYPRDYPQLSDDMAPMHKQYRSDPSHVVQPQGQSTDVNAANAYFQSDLSQNPTQETFSSPQRRWQVPAYPLSSSTNQPPADRSLSPPPRKVDTTGLKTFGVRLTDPGSTNPTVSVNSAHASKKSVEMHSGHGIGRSFRASIEGYSSHQIQSQY